MTLFVLIVDDNTTDRYLLKRRLEKIDMDVEVLEAENGEKALLVLSDYQAKRETDPRKYPPLFIFLDINMPILDGFGFLSAFHHETTDPEFAPPSVVMFTSSQSQEYIDRSMRWDFVQEFLVKGDLSLSKLEAMLRAHLASTRTPPNSTD